MDTNSFQQATGYIEEYERRINRDGPDSPERALYEDRAYKRAMMHAAIAQAEALTRIAEVAETLLEAGDLARVAKTLEGIATSGIPIEDVNAPSHRAAAWSS